MSFLKSFWDWICFPRYTQGQCFCCHRRGYVIDLGDGDLVCSRCWHEWPTLAPDAVVEAFMARRRGED